MTSKWLHFGLPILAVLVLLGLSIGPLVAWRMLKEKIRKEYPRVQQMSPETLHAWLNDADRNPPVLLDVRPETEFRVSHLPGAVRVNPGSSLEDLPTFSKQDTVVLYCSVGYRSSSLADQLVQADFEHIYNLEGSLFSWLNNGWPAVDATGEVRKAHAFNSWWGMLLQRRYRYLPPS